ncbi:MAG: hypothetical protein OEU26_09865 [Candidatus Tectomicrobia bacterium]|nr:hypothetical protein [Candidatus Tectomicrobia bacterium]
MASLDPQDTVEPVPSALTVAHVVYALHTFAIVIGIVGAATVIGSFVGSLPSILAVLLNYAKRGDARGTWAASHYRWQIRTFWFALLWALVGWALVFTLVGVVVGVPILITLTLWLIYRIGRGWLRLRDRRPMYAS